MTQWQSRDGKVLKDAGLVSDRQLGARRLYSHDPHGIDAMRTYFDRFWTKALVNFAERVERKETS